MTTMPPADILSLSAGAARQWLGATSPNPAVGCVGTDQSGNILAVAAHCKAGEGHAEASLIDGCRTRGILGQLHTIYVTLEPCNHHGRTPPCCEAILNTSIRRVVVGALDPNPEVTGGGIARLQAAGLEVAYTPHTECQWLLLPFAHSVTQQRPLITIKRAFDRNGSMQPPAGQRTFTSPSSLRLAHQLRKKADAIVTGSGTILADTPEFTVRHVPDYLNKQRILAILDRRQRVPESYLEAARQRGLLPIIYDDLNTMWSDLHQRKARDVLVEAGQELSNTILSRQQWNICVDIRKIDNEDRISTDINQLPNLGIDINTFDWRWFLPDEQHHET